MWRTFASLESTLHPSYGGIRGFFAEDHKLGAIGDVDIYAYVNGMYCVKWGTGEWLEAYGRYGQEGLCKEVFGLSREEVLRLIDYPRAFDPEQADFTPWRHGEMRPVTGYAYLSIVHERGAWWDPENKEDRYAVHYYDGGDVGRWGILWDTWADSPHDALAKYLAANPKHPKDGWAAHFAANPPEDAKETARRVMAENLPDTY